MLRSGAARSATAGLTAKVTVPVRAASQRGWRPGGFSLVEAVTAVGIFSLVAAAMLTLAMAAFSSDQRREQLLTAQALAQEGLEAARSIRNFRFKDLVPGDWGLRVAAGVWAFGAGSDTIGPYTRTIRVGAVYRDQGGFGGVVDSGSPGATIDPDSRTVTASVKWPSLSGVPQTFSLATILTRWSLKRWMTDRVTDFAAGARNSVEITAAADGEVRLADAGNWTQAAVSHTVDIGGNEDAADCAIDEARQVLYVATSARGAGRPEFYGYDIAGVTSAVNPLATVAAVEVGQTANALAVDGGYAYLATSHNSQELMVIRVVDVTLLPSWNTPGGGANANDVAVAGGVAYLVTDASGAQPELYAVDVAAPASMPATPRGTAEIGQNVNAVTVASNGAYAYLATDDNNGELVVVRLSDYQVVQRVNAGGNGNASDVAVRGNRLYLTKLQDSGAELYVYNAANPGSIPATPLGAVELNANALHLDVQGGYAFVTTDAGSAELLVVDLGTLAPPIIVNLPGSAAADSVCVFGAYADVVSRANQAEVMVVRGAEASGRFAPVGTFTSLPFDGGAATAVWDRVAWTASGDGAITLLIRTAATEAQLSAARWVGPDGTTATRYATPGLPVRLDPGATGSRWVQFRAFLAAPSDTLTPVLEDVTLFYD